MRLFIFLVVNLIIGISCGNKNNQEWEYNYKPATSAEDYAALMANPEANIIRSSSDFERFVSTNTKLKEAFDDQLLEAFSKNLKFAYGGIQSFSLGVLIDRYPNEYTVYYDIIAKGLGWIAGTHLTPLLVPDHHCTDGETIGSYRCEPQGGHNCYQRNCR